MSGKRRPRRARFPPGYFQHLVETVPGGIIEIDQAGVFRYVSPGVEALGYSPPDLIGKSFESLVSGGKISGGVPHPARPGLRQRYILLVRAKDGRQREMQLVLSPPDSGGKRVGILLVLGGGEQCWAGASGGESSDVSNDLDHQVRSPLAAIKLGLSVLGRSVQGDEASVVGIMQEKCRCLEAVVQRLLRAARTGGQEDAGNRRPHS